MKSMDLNSICRICLEANKQTFDIYNSLYAKKNVLYCEMITNCTKLKPEVKDGLPRLICKDCSRQLKRCYAFNEQCENSDRTLKSYLELLLQSNADPVIKNKNIVEVKDEEITYENDDCWDDDDDNVVLGELKVQKTLTGSICNGNNEESQVWTEKENPTVEPKSEADDTLEKETPKKPKKKLEHAAYQCDVCGKCLSTKSNLKAHKICHTSLRPFRCEQCPATFKGYSALFQHRKVHSGEFPYHCEYCSKPFRRRTGLIHHIRAHTGEKLFSCTICCKNFVQKAQLSTHMKRHKGDKSFLCQVCGKGFSVKCDLTVHQRTHNGEKPYRCHLCEKTFATSGNLSMHIRIHNKEIKYNCPECQQGFVTSSAYRVHLKRHRGQRDHRCECGKSFFTSSALKQHGVVHSGERRYQCRLCERPFAQPSHLTRHFRRHHAPPDAPLPPAHHFRRVLPRGDCAPRAARPPARDPPRASPRASPRAPASSDAH